MHGVSAVCAAWMDTLTQLFFIFLVKDWPSLPYFRGGSKEPLIFWIVVCILQGRITFDVNVDYTHLQHVFLPEPIRFGAYTKSVHRLPLQVHVTSLTLLTSAFAPSFTYISNPLLAASHGTSRYRSNELSPLFALAQWGAQQFSHHYRHIMVQRSRLLHHTCVNPA